MEMLRLLVEFVYLTVCMTPVVQIARPAGGGKLIIVSLLSIFLYIKESSGAVNQTIHPESHRRICCSNCLSGSDRFVGAVGAVGVVAVDGIVAIDLTARVATTFVFILSVVLDIMYSHGIEPVLFDLIATRTEHSIPFALGEVGIPQELSKFGVLAA
jgi:high-affinity K+ transport system ATPase subunit B